MATRPSKQGNLKNDPISGWYNFQLNSDAAAAKFSNAISWPRHAPMTLEASGGLTRKKNP